MPQSHTSLKQAIAAACLIVLPPEGVDAASCSLTPIAASEGIFRRHVITFFSPPGSPDLLTLRDDVLQVLPRLQADVAAAITSNIPANSCENRFALHSMRHAVRNGAFITTFAVNYQRWLCGSTTGVCSKGFQVYACTWDARTILFEKTVNFEAAVSAYLTERHALFRATVSHDIPSNEIERVASLIQFVVPTSAALGQLLGGPIRAYGVELPLLSKESPEFSHRFATIKSLSFAYANQNPDQFGVLVRAEVTKIDPLICRLRDAIANEENQKRCELARPMLTPRREPFSHCLPLHSSGQDRAAAQCGHEATGGFGALTDDAISGWRGVFQRFAEAQERARQFANEFNCKP